MDNELSVLCHVPRGSAAPGYLHHSLTDTLSSGFSDHDALGAASPICHDAWCGGVAPIFQRACGLHSNVQSQSNIEGPVTKPQRTAIYPYAYLTFLMFSLCEITLPSPVSAS